MATETENYKLKKPAASDFYNIEDFNGNMDLIDAALKALAEGKAGLDDEGKLILEQLPDLGQLNASRIYAGSYTGTGGVGEDSPNSLTFPSEPQLLIVKQTYGYSEDDLPTWESGILSNAFIVVRGMRRTVTKGSIMISAGTGQGYQAQYLYFTWEGNTVSWYCGSSPLYASGQMNYSGKTYEYIAICT